MGLCIFPPVHNARRHVLCRDYVSKKCIRHRCICLVRWWVGKWALLSKGCENSNIQEKSFILRKCILHLKQHNFKDIIYVHVSYTLSQCATKALINTKICWQRHMYITLFFQKVYSCRHMFSKIVHTLKCFLNLMYKKFRIKKDSEVKN